MGILQGTFSKLVRNVEFDCLSVQQNLANIKPTKLMGIYQFISSLKPLTLKKMFKYLLIVVFVGVVCADDDAHAHVSKDIRKNDGHGHFTYGYDITNGIGADESGDEHEVHGEYHFISKEGIPVKVSYTADEHGFHPHSELLPIAPPTPPAILKALKYLKEHPQKQQEQHHPKRLDSGLRHP